MAVPTPIAPGAARTAAPGRRSGGVHGPIWVPYAFCAPFLLLFCTFVLVPAVYGVWISLHDFDFLLPSRPFVGLQNYADLFDPEGVYSEPFWNSLRNTLFFTVVSVPFLVALPLLIAIMLNRAFPGRTFFRAVFFAPFVLGVAVIGLMWRYLLDTSFGTINSVLGRLGLPDDTPWLTDQPYAWISLVGVTIWWTIGFNSVIYLAGLAGVPNEQYEAASLDGAGAWAKFRWITLPSIRNVLIFVVITTVLASANMFGQSYLITNGGPGQSTETAIMMITNVGLSQYKMGAAAAMSYILALFLALISIVNFWLMREKK
ncbi:carbohydrate ABC transporter permease [Propionibacteriaceae bacterium Y1700]|uniref:carbohydrate ABC transporter permease n=1 Tax=Microlunatus sp. Y1700 TaxID=3418487 RepID=UPI003DA70DF9